MYNNNMYNNKSTKDRDNPRPGKNNNGDDRQMTSEELIESIRGKIQRTLAEKAENPTRRGR